MSSVNHNDLAGIGASDHHAKTTSSEILLADMGEKNHASLDNVLSSQHHARYVDAEAVSAMGAKADGNPLNHDKYTNAEVDARIALADLADLATKPHSALTGVTADQHHNRLHQIAGASDHAGTANSIIYIDASGNVQELTLGTSGHHLMSQGAGSAPAWEAPPECEETYTQYDNDKPPIIIAITNIQYTQAGTTWGDYYYCSFDWAEHYATDDGGHYAAAKMGVWLKSSSGSVNAECRLQAMSSSLGVIDAETVTRASTSWAYVETGDIDYASTIKGFRHSLRSAGSAETAYSIGASVILDYVPPVETP